MPALPAPIRLTGGGHLSIDFNANGSMRRMDCGETVINLFPGSEVEAGPANVYLRRGVDAAGRATDCIALLGPGSPTHLRPGLGNALEGAGEWRGIRYAISLRLAVDAPSWYWHVTLENASDAAQHVDLVHAQDIALAPYGIIRLNEYYVSQYVDHTALEHKTHGIVVASRQNLPAKGRTPWCVIGSLSRGRSYATDAVQLYGVANRAGNAPVALLTGLPGRRLQQEHSLVAIQTEVVKLESQARTHMGFFGGFVADHPAATSEADLAAVDDILDWPEAKQVASLDSVQGALAATSVFNAPALATLDLDQPSLQSMFGTERRHEEFDAQGQLLSFFCGADRHVVLRAKELRVQRPHGHVLRSGEHATPDETALTSTTWMTGVFHSMLTQGHVSFNRLLSTVHSYIGLFRSQGQRVFAEIDGAWRLLDLPSAYEMAPGHCRWIYRHAGGVIEVRSGVDARAGAHQFSLQVQVLAGAPLRFLVSNHVAMNGDDGATRGRVAWSRAANVVSIDAAAGTELRQRFARGSFQLEATGTTLLDAVGGDELLFGDGESRDQSYVCLVTAAAQTIGLLLRSTLIEASPDVPSETLAPGQVGAATLRLLPPARSPLALQVERIADIVPWFTHNALVHYLSPRGLEQYSGGGWGTRDVCQGPVELLLAAGHASPVRDLLLRVFRAQQPDGDWPQWFMFFERDRDVRAGDSHGDIVFWPVLALAQYLLASGDGAFLDERAPFFGDDASFTVWQHAERALALIDRRVVTGTSLAAYGHGDWNDALQPADPRMREHMCSAWTVTLHYQTLVTLCAALRMLDRDAEAQIHAMKAQAVREDFQRVLLVDGVLAGYALFECGSTRYLLHPRDAITGVRYSALAMIHAILEDLFTPQQARQHLQLIDKHLSGPDGVRLFDRPMPYHGGPMRFFQRAESATFFGREIGLMYMHAHLRYAQALAHMGEADRFFRALCQANPLGIAALVPQATLRQVNCYYSSSDAAFVDRYQASAEYSRVAEGTVALDGGWRVYSSGAGIAMGLIVRRFLGLTLEFDAVILDPVMPVTLNGLQAQLSLRGFDVTFVYEVQGAGCGVSSVTVNGRSMALTHRSNPHRRGAARIPLPAFLAQLASGNNTVRIALG